MISKYPTIKQQVTDQASVLVAVLLRSDSATVCKNEFLDTTLKNPQIARRLPSDLDCQSSRYKRLTPAYMSDCYGRC